MEIIQAVTVVPIFAPITTPVDSINVINPAFTKLTTITVVVDDDWVMDVVAKPVRMPLNLVLVIPLSIARSLLPATFWRPSLNTFIP
jgi:phage gp29-like protein